VRRDVLRDGAFVGATSFQQSLPGAFQRRE
jgi:hypothetical protein